MSYENKQTFITDRGFKQDNMWSWNTEPDANRRILFTAWVDKEGTTPTGSKYYTVQEPWWGINANGDGFQKNRINHDASFDMVFNRGFTPFLFYITAVDLMANPRVIATVEMNYVDSCLLAEQPNGHIWAFPTSRIFSQEWKKSEES